MVPPEELHRFLIEKERLFNRPAFIERDPIRIPHSFTRKEDVEISAFLTALIAWGRRDLILRSAEKWMSLMEGSPFLFISEAGAAEWKRFITFVHRTLNGTDAVALMKGLRHLYRHQGGLEAVMAIPPDAPDVFEAIVNLRTAFLKQKNFPAHTQKHLADPAAGSAAKRINMFLRWMVRKDKAGVDLGIWKAIQPAQLICPLDVHTGNVARKLGLLKRSQNDWRAAVELTHNLKAFSATDPVRFDIALFALGESGEI